MSDTPIRLTQITLASNDMPAMVQFYASVFGIDLQPVAAYGTTLYRGMLNGAAFVLCPNTLAAVMADQSRHQWAYTVADLGAIVERVLAAGGMVQEQTSLSDQPANAVVRDPDGNSIVFFQQQD